MPIKSKLEKIYKKKNEKKNNYETNNYENIINSLVSLKLQILLRKNLN